jgi:outer membrane scaffolding protein for murein synthesis (MipA/OmpV family)
MADREEDERRISREQRARRRDRCKSGDDTDDDETASLPISPVIFTKHVRGPGDEEDYETPAKLGKRSRKSQMTAGSAASPTVGKGVRRKRSRADVSGKMVRWDKGLILLSGDGNGSIRTCGSRGDAESQPKSCIREEKKVCPP